MNPGEENGWTTLQKVVPGFPGEVATDEKKVYS
jgi:hypothetical protein